MTPIEFVQTKFIRWLLGVNKFCSSNACRSEVGRFPMRTKTKCRAIKYWLKFCEPEHQNKLSGIAFTDQIGQDKKELWPSKLKRLLNLAGLGDIWSAKTNTPAIMSHIIWILLTFSAQEAQIPAARWVLQKHFKKDLNARSGISRYQRNYHAVVSSLKLKD